MLRRHSRLPLLVVLLAFLLAWTRLVASPLAPEDLEKASFARCPVPTCHAPCNPSGLPDVECKFQGGGEGPTTFACCCCGGTGNSFQALTFKDWPQYGFNPAHSSLNTAEKSLTRSNVGSLVEIGEADLGTGTPSAPIVAGTVVYVAAGGSILAIDARDRSLIWSSLSCDGSATAEPAYANGRVFAGDEGGELAAYDARTGALLWCRDEGGSIVSAPAVDGNNVYVTNEGDVVAVDQATGNSRWRFTVTGVPGPSSSPAVGTSVFVTGPGAVYALRKSDGRQIWKRALGAPYELSSPAVNGDTVYVGADHLYALATGDGKIRWTSQAAGVNVSMPAISGNRLYVNAQDPRFGLFAIDAKNGASVWRSMTAGESLATPSVANGVVYDITEFGALLVLDAANGAVLNTLGDQGDRPFAAGLGAQAAVVNGAVFVVTGDPALANALDVFAMAPPPIPLEAQ